MKKIFILGAITLVVAVLSFAVTTNKDKQVSTTDKAKSHTLSDAKYSANVSTSHKEVAKPVVKQAVNTNSGSVTPNKSERVISPMPNCYTYRSALLPKKVEFCDME